MLLRDIRAAIREQAALCRKALRTPSRHRVEQHARWRLDGMRKSAASAACLRSRALYLAREMIPLDTTARYELKDVPRAVKLRHHTDDTGVFAEIFCDKYYELPERVNASLRSLGPRARFIDLGANIGLFGVWVLAHFPEARVTSYEPDPFALGRLSEVIAMNDAEDAWDVIPGCASNYNGVTAFAATGTSMSRAVRKGDNTENLTQVPVMDVFADLLRAHVVKIDIEGGEWSILLDSRWCDIRATVVLMEYHPDQCPEPDARTLARARLRRAGYVVEDIMLHEAGHGMLRAIRE